MPLTVAAVVLVSMGLAVQVWAGLELGWRRALGLTDDPPDPVLPRLVLGGPFRIVRHPQAFGMLLIFAGALLQRPSAGAALVALVAGALVIGLAVRHDGELARRYGEAYARYRQAVPFLVPLPSAALPGERGGRDEDSAGREEGGKEIRTSDSKPR